MADVTLDGSPTPELHVNQSGTVLVEFSDGERVRFESIAAYDRAMEFLDRQRAVLGYQQTFDTDAYWSEVRRRNAERRSLRAVKP